MLNILKDRFKRKKRYLGSNINFLLTRDSLDVATLSLHTGVPVATIFRMKKHENNPTLSSLEPIAEYFDIDLNELLYVDISTDEYRSKNLLSQGVKYIPVFALTEFKKWPNTVVAKIHMGTSGNVSDESFGLKIDTLSFVPVFYEGTVIIVDPSAEAKDGDFVVCILGGEKIPVMRQIFFDGKKAFFKPINPHVSEVNYSKNYKVIGVVVRSIESYR